MAKVQIIGMPQSPLVWAAKMMTIEKGIDADFIAARPHSPEVLAIQPFGKIPVMRHGDVEIAETVAMARYFDTLVEANPLTPRDLVAGAQCMQWVMHFHTEFKPIVNRGYIVEYFFADNDEPDRAAIDAIVPQVQKCVDILEKQLAGRDYLVGSFSLADIFFGPVLHYTSTLPEGGEMIAAAPNVKAYLARVSARPAFKATFPPPMPARAAA